VRLRTIYPSTQTSFADSIPDKKEAHLITWKEVLQELRRCDGQITDYGNPVGQILFDPAVGVGRAGERIEAETFSLLCEEGWIATQDQGRIKRYTISETGITRLLEVESLAVGRAGNLS
jgi:hypothetical protein